MRRKRFLWAFAIDFIIFMFIGQDICQNTQNLPKTDKIRIYFRDTKKKINKRDKIIRSGSCEFVVYSGGSVVRFLPSVKKFHFKKYKYSKQYSERETFFQHVTRHKELL